MMQQTDALKSLDGLLAELGGVSNAGPRTGDSRGALTENLAAARRCLLGCAHAEYRVNLQHAAESASYLNDKTVRDRTKLALQSLLG
jgi:hypothetical protein